MKNVLILLMVVIRYFCLNIIVIMVVPINDYYYKHDKILLIEPRDKWQQWSYTLIVCCWHGCRSALVSLNSLARIVALSQLSFSRVVALLEEGLYAFSLFSACACGRVVKDTKITMVDTSTIIEGTVKFRDGKKVRILSFSNFKICVDCLNIIR